MPTCTLCGQACRTGQHYYEIGVCGTEAAGALHEVIQYVHADCMREVSVRLPPKKL